MQYPLCAYTSTIKAYYVVELAVKVFVVVHSVHILALQLVHVLDISLTDPTTAKNVTHVTARGFPRGKRQHVGNNAQRGRKPFISKNAKPDDTWPLLASSNVIKKWPLSESPNYRCPFYYDIPFVSGVTENHARRVGGSRPVVRCLSPAVRAAAPARSRWDPRRKTAYPQTEPEMLQSLTSPLFVPTSG